MSLSISSDESEDLPQIDLGLQCKEQTQLSSSIHEDCDFVDLTQELNQDEELVVRLDVTSDMFLDRKHGIKSPSHISDELHVADNDLLFDNIVKTVAPKMLELCQSSKSGASGSSGTSGYDSGNSCVSSQSRSKKRISTSDKVTKKQKLAEERVKKATATELNKRYKPGECMKYMVVRMHPALRSSWYMSALDREVTAHIVEDDSMVHQHLLMWSRRGQNTLTNNEGQLEMTDNMESCDHALLIHTMDELVPYITEHTLSVYVTNIMEMCSCALTLVVFGAKDYFKKCGKSGGVSEVELELSLAGLVAAGGAVTRADAGCDLALLVAHCTKANAEKPYKLAKRLCDEQADFYMRGDNKKCVPVDKDGHGSSRLWQQMVAVLPQSSLETARAVCAQYKSPLHLYESLSEEGSVPRLASVPVGRSALPGARARLLGKEFARKLHILFTSDDGDALVE